MRSRYPGCAARPWASEFNRVAVGIPGTNAMGNVTRQPRTPTTNTNHERQRRSIPEPRVAQRTLGGNRRKKMDPEGVLQRGVEPRWGFCGHEVAIPRVRCATLGFGVQPRCGWNSRHRRDGQRDTPTSNTNVKHQPRTPTTNANDEHQPRTPTTKHQPRTPTAFKSG